MKILDKLKLRDIPQNSLTLFFQSMKYKERLSCHKLEKTLQIKKIPPETEKKKSKLLNHLYKSTVYLVLFQNKIFKKKEKWFQLVYNEIHI